MKPQRRIPKGGGRLSISQWKHMKMLSSVYGRAIDISSGQENVGLSTMEFWPGDFGFIINSPGYGLVT